MKHERNNLMKRSLEKWGRAPIILGVLVEHPLFWECSSSTHSLGGHEHSPFKGAQALIVWRIAKQRTIEQMQNGHERNKLMKCSLEKMRARTHYFWGLDEHPSFWGLDEHPSFWGLEHPFSRRARALIIQREIEWRTDEWTHVNIKRNLKRISSWSTPLKNGGAHPLF